LPHAPPACGARAPGTHASSPAGGRTHTA
jgi:hypothetical protein